MKKLLLGLAIGLLSFSSYSSDLKCSESYDIFQGIISGAVEVRRNGDLKQIKAHNERYDYPALFNKNHPGQFYLYGWMDESKYDNTLNYFSYMIKSGRSKGHKAILLKPKADFISSVGEVCIIPMYYFVNIDGKQGGSLTDVFFVRDIQNNEWRVLTYTGDEPKEEIDEFFPDLPKKIKVKLSKAKLYD
ncbi:hypothetical protein [Acinetobacter sp.]|uniref:hypothetical protein n=1 Tax=Acinetobacter sp. TaxID=472 RepID=UPI003341B25E